MSVVMKLDFDTECLKAYCQLFSPATSLMFWKICVKKTLKLPNKHIAIIVKVWK